MPGEVNSFFLYGNNLEYILFKNAVSFAEEGKNVWFISPECINEIPTGIKVIDREALKLLTFLYLKDDTELLKQLNSIHTWYRIPEIIILNHFQTYISINCENSIKRAFICANLLDACMACNRKLSKITTLIVAYDTDPCNDTVLQSIVDLYFDQVIDGKDLPSNCIISADDIK